MKNKKTSKVVIVTGASGGIGSSICNGLMKSGFRVIGIDQKAKVISKKVMYEHITADLEKYVLNLEYQKEINLN
jgi:NADP-dependent 3-hydroxy acid dehydrogenase YdfG